MVPFISPLTIILWIFILGIIISFFPSFLTFALSNWTITSKFLFYSILIAYCMVLRSSTGFTSKECFSSYNWSGFLTFIILTGVSHSAPLIGNTEQLSYNFVTSSPSFSSYLVLIIPSPVCYGTWAFGSWALPIWIVVNSFIRATYLSYSRVFSSYINSVSLQILKLIVIFDNLRISLD